MTIETNVQATLEYLDAAIDAAHRGIALVHQTLGAARNSDQRKGSELALAVADRRLDELKTVRKLLTKVA
jgi:hypothetical protein